MAIRLAIIGLDLIQHEWLEAVGSLVANGEIELVGTGHRTLAMAKDVADWFKTGPRGGEGVPAYDDLRLLVKERTPQVLLMDRPANATMEFLMGCMGQEIGILSLGPPVDSLAEAQALAGVLEAQTRLLYTWPRFADAPVFTHCAQADEYVRPIRFAAATWLGVNHALARTLAENKGGGGAGGVGNGGIAEKGLSVRSLSVLAWDAIGTLVRLMQLPTSVYAAVRGTVGSGDSFADLTGAASLTLRFAEDVAASITLCDRVPTPEPTVAGPGRGWQSRDLMLWGGGGTVRLNSQEYEFRDVEGKMIDAGPSQVGSDRQMRSSGEEAQAVMREFLKHFVLPPSPHRGWMHGLEDIAATMEAVVVSHRTGQAESPEKFRKLRR